MFSQCAREKMTHTTAQELARRTFVLKGRVKIFGELADVAKLKVVVMMQIRLVCPDLNIEVLASRSSFSVLPNPHDIDISLSGELDALESVRWKNTRQRG